LDEGRQARLGKLKFRAWRRGLRELDLMVGPFADARLAGFDDVEVEAFERLLDAPDQDLMNWLLDRAPVPPEFNGPVFAGLKAFAQDGFAKIPDQGADV
jgi:antitoxin CptB